MNNFKEVIPKMDHWYIPIAGFVAAFLSAIVPGAVNLNVVYTTLRHGARAVIPIVIAAAIGEVILSSLALHCGMTVDHMVRQNLLIQYGLAILLICIGIYMLIRKEVKTVRNKSFSKNARFVQGLLLSILNPPVLIFWLVAFSFLTMKIHLDLDGSVITYTLLFFGGVFVGKVACLWVYMKLSSEIAKRAIDLTGKINMIIGSLVLIVGIIQLVKLAL